MSYKMANIIDLVAGMLDDG